MNRYRTLAAVGSAVERVKNDNFSASNISQKSVGAPIDPILGIDHFAIRGPVFPPHPHAGFSPITYLFEDGQGRFISRTSNGQTHELMPGGIIWNVSGKGILHEEYPKVKGELSKGLQVLINLPAENKMDEPYILHLDAPDVPLYTEQGVRVRIISGEAKNLKAAINPPGNITFLDIQLEPGRKFETSLPAEDNVLVYIINGEILAGRNKEKLSAGQAAAAALDGDGINFEARHHSAHIILLSGRPLNQPIIKLGSVVGNTGGQTSFVMNTQTQIDLSLKRYNNGEMGSMEPANDYSFLNF